MSNTRIAMFFILGFLLQGIVAITLKGVFYVSGITGTIWILLALAWIYIVVAYPLANRGNSLSIILIGMALSASLYTTMFMSFMIESSIIVGLIRVATISIALLITRENVYSIREYIHKDDEIENSF